MKHATAVDSTETGIIYGALELSKSNWLLAVQLPHRRKASLHRFRGGDHNGLVSHLTRLQSHTASGRVRVRLVYEAGYDGFWLARRLPHAGIEAVVIDPASLQVNRRARRSKTDRLDVQALLRVIQVHDRGDHHVCALVRVPSAEDEDRRRSHRERQRLIRERTGHINRIRGLLFAQGIRDINPAARRHPIDLERLRTGEGQPLPGRLKAEIGRERQRLAVVEDQIRQVETERDADTLTSSTDNTKREQLQTLRGIGAGSAALLTREIFYRHFPNRRQLASYLGLAPAPYDSGEESRCQGISKAGNARARTTLIELAWMWLRYQPESDLSRWYQQRTQGQSVRVRRIFIVALARKLGIALWRYLEHGQLPSGAQLKSALVTQY